MQERGIEDQTLCQEECLLPAVYLAMNLYMAAVKKDAERNQAKYITSSTMKDFDSTRKKKNF